MHLKIAIVSLDTRGGIQPYLALANGLVASGHDVRLAAPENFAAPARRTGAAFYGFEGDVEQLLQRPDARGVAEKGFVASHRFLLRVLRERVGECMRVALDACQDRELMLGGMGGMLVGAPVAEKLKIPFIEAHLQPLTTTSEFPGILAMAAPNRLSHWLTRQIFWQPLRPVVTAARREVLDLPSGPFWWGTASDPGRPVLYGISPSLVPRPADWGENIHLTGYWFSEGDASWTPPDALTRFLEEGDRPICIGFGSMSSQDPGETTRIVLRALEQTGLRAVLLSGWGGLERDELPASVLMLDAVPHEWLFPRMAAVVHHGGAGTTAAGLRAGVPSVVIPFTVDQPFWGRRVAAAGVGPKPIQRKSLTAEKLAEALRIAVGDKAIGERARRLGEQIRAEDGVSSAVRVIEDAFGCS